MSLFCQDNAPLLRPESFVTRDAKAFRDDDRDPIDTCLACQQEARQRERGSLSTAKVVGRILLLALVFLFGCAATYSVYPRRGLGQDTYETDFAPARKAVELERRRFTGAPLFDSDGLPYFSEEDSQIPYLATSSEAVMAWEELIAGEYTYLRMLFGHHANLSTADRYFLVTEEEALQAWGPDYKRYYRYPDIPGHPGGYVGGLDVLHSLHCVNELRKFLHKDHCNQNESATRRVNDRYHVVHCLEMMRQNIQCKGDLSLVPAIWWPSINNGNGSSFIFSEQMHTCRNFEKIRQWASERYARTRRMGESKQLPPNDV